MSQKNVGLLLDVAGDLVPANAAQFEVLNAFFANKVFQLWEEERNQQQA